MKRLLILLIILSFSVVCVSAKARTYKTGSIPKGVFKKNWKGDIVQYDNNGKKVHTYKMKNGKVTRIK